MVTPFPGILLHCSPPGLSRHQLTSPGGRASVWCPVAPACVAEEAAVPIGGGRLRQHTRRSHASGADPLPPERAPGSLTLHPELPKPRIRPTGTARGRETFRPDSDRTEERKLALTGARPRLGPAVRSGSFLPSGLTSHRGMERGRRSQASRADESSRAPCRGSPRDEDARERGRGARREFREHWRPIPHFWGAPLCRWGRLCHRAAGGVGPRPRDTGRPVVFIPSRHHVLKRIFFSEER